MKAVRSRQFKTLPFNSWSQAIPHWRTWPQLTVAYYAGNLIKIPHQSTVFFLLLDFTDIECSKADPSPYSHATSVQRLISSVVASAIRWKALMTAICAQGNIKLARDTVSALTALQIFVFSSSFLNANDTVACNRIKLPSCCSRLFVCVYVWLFMRKSVLSAVTRQIE